MNSISSKEMKYILSIVGFTLVWFLLIIPFLLSKGIEDTSVYLQFLIFNLFIFIFLQIFLKARTLKSKVNLKSTFGIIFLVMSLDILIPPFLVSKSGELLNSIILKSAGTDYVIGHFAINFLGLSGILVFLFTYILVPAIFLLIAAHLLPNLVRHV